MVQFRTSEVSNMGILTQLEVDFDIEIVEDFISHYAIMCENMEPLIIGLNIYLDRRSRR